MANKIIVAASAVAGLSAAHNPLTGCIVGTQLRCEGNHCPNWAFDVSRYDTIMYKDTEQFEYVLNENLPLGPTSERSFNMHSAYSPKTRNYVSVAADYYVDGVDSYWISTINDYANESTPVFSNVILAHPDATPDHPGSISLQRIVTLSDERTIAIFNTGEVHLVDVKGQRYSLLTDISKTAKFAALMTDAHAVDGNVLKSFIMDANEGIYLVTTDFSGSVPTISEPVLITMVQGANRETPINALMMSPDDSVAPRLTLILHGVFDQINYVDEKTGIQTPIISNLMDEQVPSIFACYEGTKDCDFWRNAAYDEENHLLYFQAHDMSSGTASTTMLKMGFTVSKVNGEWYPYINTAMWPMNFGYGGYQYVTIKQ